MAGVRTNCLGEFGGEETDGVEASTTLAAAVSGVLAATLLGVVSGVAATDAVGAGATTTKSERMTMVWCLLVSSKLP